MDLTLVRVWRSFNRRRSYGNQKLLSHHGKTASPRSWSSFWKQPWQERTWSYAWIRMNQTKVCATGYRISYLPQGWWTTSPTSTVTMSRRCISEERNYMVIHNKHFLLSRVLASVHRYFSSVSNLRVRRFFSSYKNCTRNYKKRLYKYHHTK